VLSDAALISSSLTESERFAEAYDRHVVAIHRYLARRVGPPHANDLAAGVFPVAFRIRGRYDVNQPNARPWLYGVVTNLIHRHRRTERAHYSMLARSSADPLGVPDHADAVSSRVAAAAQAREAARVPEKLAAKERDVFCCSRGRS
jgi:RNA polymerase sigma-70 factor (ECF subfamily)